MASPSELVVIFKGSKFFWRTRNTIDVTIVEHGDCKVTEVICYEPSIDMEASRVYLDTAILGKRVDPAQVEEKLSFAKRNNVPLTEKFVRDATNQATADYIFNRLIQTDFTVSPKKFEINFQLNFRDVVIEAGDDCTERLIRGPPSELVPFTTCHNKIFSECQKDEAMKALEDAKHNLQEHCLTAIALQAQPQLSLGFKELWRIPIVLGKLAHNRVLSDEDSKIWDTVASKLKTQEDIDRITRVTLRTVEPEPEPVVALAPAAKKTFGFGRFFLPVVKRASTSPPSASQTPVTAPCPTPRSVHSTRSCATPRSSSRTLMADTANSQRRANSCAEDNALKKKCTGTKKKTSVRRAAPRPRGRSAGAEAHADNSSGSAIASGDQTPVFTPAARSAQEASSFMSQLVTALNFTLSGERNKVHSMPTEMDFQNASLKNKQDSAEVSAERRHLGAMNPRLLATSSTASSLKTEFAFLNCSEPSPILHTQFIVTGKSTCGAGMLERNATMDISGSNSMYEESSVSPTRKRRSYLGSFLATMSSTLDAYGFDSTAELSAKKYPSRRAGMLGFDWLLGSHSQPVVPVDVDLVDCQ